MVAAFLQKVAGGALLAALAAPSHAQVRHPAHDYPTAARADYVIGCLAGSGFKREYLERCACAVDVIADLMPYEDYEQAETILSMQQGGLGERGAMFRDTPLAKERTDELRRAQAEASLQCK